MVFGLLLVGCSDWGLIAQDGSYITRMSGAGPLANSQVEPFDAARLATMINNSIPGRSDPPAANNSAAAPVLGTTIDPNTTRLDKALADFGKSLHEKRGSNGGTVRVDSTEKAAIQNQLRDARNGIQDQVMAASVNRCNYYKILLRRESTMTQFTFGSLATALGGAGALFTNSTAAILSGSAAVSSGINAEYQRDFLSSLTSSIIIPGIDKQRAALATQIFSRRCMSVSDYPLGAALLEAFYFHSACSADTGVAVASQSISQTHTSSLDEVQNALAKIQDIHNQMAQPNSKVTTQVAVTAPASPAPAANNVAPASPPVPPVATDQGNATAKTTTTTTTTTTTPAEKLTLNPVKPTLPLGDSIELQPCNPLNEFGQETAPTLPAKPAAAVAAATPAPKPLNATAATGPSMKLRLQ